MPLDDPDKNLFHKMRAACRHLATTVRHTIRHYLNTPNDMEHDKETRKPNINSISHYSTTTTRALLSHHVTKKSWKIGGQIKVES